MPSLFFKSSTFPHTTGYNALAFLETEKLPNSVSALRFVGPTERPVHTNFSAKTSEPLGRKTLNPK